MALFIRTKRNYTQTRGEENGRGGGQPEVCELVEKRVSNRLYKLERASCAQLSSYLSDWANSSRIHQRREGEKIRQWKRPVLENFPSRFRECGRRQGDHIDDGTSITFRAIWSVLAPLRPAPPPPPPPSFISSTFGTVCQFFSFRASPPPRLHLLAYRIIWFMIVNSRREGRARPAIEWAVKQSQQPKMTNRCSISDWPSQKRKIKIGPVWLASFIFPGQTLPE